MEGLANYGSDDDCDESPQRGQRDASPYNHESAGQSPNKYKSHNHKNHKEKTSKTSSRSRGTKSKSKGHKDAKPDDNYDDIGMELSENEDKCASSSFDSSKSGSPSHTPPRTDKLTQQQPQRLQQQHKDRSRSRSKSRSGSGGGNKDKPKSFRAKEKEKGRRNRSQSRSRSSKSKSRSRSRSRSRSKSPPSSATSRRQSAGSGGGRADRYGKRDGRDHDRGGKRPYSYQRRRSRSPANRETRTGPKDYPKDNYRRDTRGDSRDFREGREAPRPRDRYSKRFDRASNKLAHLEKMGIDVNKSQEKKFDRLDVMSLGVATTNLMTTASKGEPDSRLLPPGVTGRLREQMERRKALWQKKDPERDVPSTMAACVPSAPLPNTSGKVWEATTFAHDQEGKQANKFKRLMGIREPASQNEKPVTDMAKKQEELFSSMEQQYEVARTATHTMRGVGLGFGSYQR